MVILGESQYKTLIINAMATKIDAGRASTLADAVPFIDRLDLELARNEDAAQHGGALATALDAELNPDDDADLD